MPDSTPVTADRTVVVHRHGLLTYLSLAFNALILLLILGALVHHHKMRGAQGNDGRMGQPGWANHESDRDGGNRDEFHHGGNFGPMRHGWGHQEGSDQRGGGDGCPMCSPGGEHRAFGGEEDRESGDRPGFGMNAQRGWGGGRPGFGGPRMMGGGSGMSGTPPSAEEMTDRFMLMLAPKLALTDAESAQIRPIITGGIQQFQKDMAAQKLAHEKMIQDAKSKIRAVLTPDQQKQFDEATAGLGGAPNPPSPAAGK